MYLEKLVKLRMLLNCEKIRRYINKTIPNKVYLLKHFFGFKLDPSIDLEANVDRFNRLSCDLAFCDKKLSKDQLAVVLLNSFGDIYVDVKSAIEYGRETLTTDIIICALRNKELELKSERKNLLVVKC